VADNTTVDSAPRALKFYLVGQDHVYSMNSREAGQSERQKIEQDYADNLAAYQAEYKRVLESGDDPVAAAQDLDVALQSAAADRDARLAGLYATADDLRLQHPELQVDGDAPYQVVAVRSHEEDSTPVFDSYTVYAPWPGYTVEEYPYGWRYGVVYNPVRFRSTYDGWHRSFVASGRAFTGLRSHSGRVEPDLIVRRSGARYGLRSVSSSKYARSRAGSRYGSVLPHTPSRYNTLGRTTGTGRNRYLSGQSGAGASRYSHTLGNGTSGARKYASPDARSRYYRGPSSQSMPGSSKYSPPSRPDSRYNRGVDGAVGNGAARESQPASGTSRYNRGSNQTRSMPSGTFGGARSPSRGQSDSRTRGGGSQRGKSR